MAAIRSYKNGAGGSSGADLAVLKPVLSSGVFWYVGNATPGASDANAGTERTKPLLTSAQANTNASAGDTVVYLSGHNEIIGTSVVLSHAGLALVGEGTGASVPRFTCSASIAMFSIGAAGIILDNLYFPASTAVPTARVSIASTNTIMNAIQCDCGANDTTAGLVVTAGAGAVRVTNSRFTSVAAGAAIGMSVTSATSDIFMDTVTFDGGSFGWSDYALKATAAISRLRATRVYLLNGSNVILPTGTTGNLNVAGASGDSVVSWTP